MIIRKKHVLFFCIHAGLILFCLFPAEGKCQTSGSEPGDSTKVFRERRGVGGAEAGYGFRSDDFKGLFFRLFYEAQIDRTFLNAGAFSYQKIDEGFGFDFRLRFPSLFYPSGSHTNFSPLAGISFTVWPTTKATVSIGFPVGLEYEFETENLPNLSVSANAAPLINLSSDKNYVIFDIRLGIRFD